MLAIITSHPIQYQAPLWKALAASDIGPMEVWFLTPHAVRPTFDREFNHSFAWDVDLLQGYPHRFLEVRDGWNLNSFRGIRLRRPWRALFKERGVTRVWVEGWRFQALWNAVSAAKRRGIEVWMRGETNDLRKRSGIREHVRRILLRHLFKKVDRFLCIGTANRRFYESLGQTPEKLWPAPYCVDNSRFATQAAALRPERGRLRRAWGVPDSKVCVLFCGKFIPKKRPMDVVAAVMLLGEGFHILFVGDGELGSSLREATQATYDAQHAAAPRQTGLPTASYVGFLNQQDIVGAYVAADCLVLPSDAGETWGLVVNEAMATGLPCIASDRCGCAEDLVPPAAVYPLGDVERLAECIKRIADAPPAATDTLERIEKFAPAATVESVHRLMQLQRTLQHA